MNMGNICGCNVFEKEVGMLPPVPVQYQSLDIGKMASQPSYPSMVEVDLTSVAIGGIAAAVLIYIVFGKFWGRE
jgi:hypothetical protein